MNQRERFRASVAATVLALLLAACAINPATGKRQLVLVSEGQETRMGQASDKGVLAQFGSYEDPELQEYVETLGKKLAATSERPDLDWTFRVVDDRLVNAFALPGGYIYITRGILAHFNSEAELASVLGHEIGHVTARHSVNQMSKAQLFQVALGVGMMVSEGLERFGDVAGAGLGVLFLKFGRDDERQADDLGLRYMMRASYDPRPMAEVFSTLRRVGDSRGGEGPPAWLATHPDPENREARTLSAIAATGQDFSNSLVRRDEYLRRIDGIVFGEDPRQGFFEESRFFHPEMAFRIDFPDGWKLQNLRERVAAVSPEGDAMLRLSLSDKGTAADALRQFMGQEGVARTGSRDRQVHGLSAQAGTFTAIAQGGTLQGEVLFVEFGAQVFQILGFSAQPRWDSFRPAVQETLASFQRLADSEILNVQPERIRLVYLDRTLSAEEFATRHGGDHPTTELALLNGLDPQESYQAGRTYKMIR